MADDASSYPAALDTFTALPALKSGTPSESDYHKKYQDAIVEIETALGTNVDKRIGKTYANEAARDAAIPSDILGDRAFLTNKGHGCFSDGTTWWPIPLIATGTTSVTFTAGQGTVTFGCTFPAVPTFTWSAYTSQLGPVSFYGHIYSLSTTAAVLTVVYNGANASGSIFISWQAIYGTFG